LWVEVDKKNFMAHFGKRVGKMKGEGSLAYATFVIENANNFYWHVYFGDV